MLKRNQPISKRHHATRDVLRGIVHRGNPKELVCLITNRKGKPVLLDLLATRFVKMGVDAILAAQRFLGDGQGTLAVAIASNILDLSEMRHDERTQS